MARPGGAQALRAIQEALDEGRSLPVVNYIPLPTIGEGLWEWFEAPSYEEGVGVDGKIRGLALGWGLGVSPVVKCSRQIEPLFKGRRKQGCKRPWLAPKGHRLCEPYKKPLTKGGFCP